MGVRKWGGGHREMELSRSGRPALERHFSLNSTHQQSKMRNSLWSTLFSEARSASLTSCAALLHSQRPNMKSLNRSTKQFQQHKVVQPLPFYTTL